MWDSKSVLLILGEHVGGRDGQGKYIAGVGALASTSES
jgi:hypothetical protein